MPQPAPQASTPQPPEPPTKQPAKRADTPKKAPAKKAPAKKKVPNQQQKDKQQVPTAYFMDNPKYKPGQPMLPESELKKAGASVAALHDYCIKKSAAGPIDGSITVQYGKKHFLTSGGYFLIAFSDLFDLFNISELDVSLMRCWAL
jgi:hypothetical protein